MGRVIRRWLWDVEPEFFYRFENAEIEIRISNGGENFVFKGKGIHLFAFLYKLFKGRRAS